MIRIGVKLEMVVEKGDTRLVDEAKEMGATEREEENAESLL